MEKNLRKKVLKFHTKKVLRKKVLRMNSRPYFSRTFFWPQYDFVKKSPRKKSLLTSEKCMIHNSRFFFSSDLFSLWVFIPGILFPETLLAAPHAILGKKSQGIQNKELYFQWHFSKDFIKFKLYFSKFLFPGFFQKLFSSGLSYTDSMAKTTKCSML